MMRTDLLRYKPWLLGVAVLTLLGMGVSWATTKLLTQDPSARVLPLLYRLVDTKGALHGLSDLTTGSDGKLYAVAERQRVVLELNTTRGAPLVRKSFALVGVPSDTDTEALAVLADGRLALGTENKKAGRASDDILFAVRDKDRFVVKSTRALPYALFDMKAETNRGIEALCAVGSTLLAGLEQVKVVGKDRLAPLARWDEATQRWTAFYVRLSSDTGKLSGMTCKLRHVAAEAQDPQNDVIDVWAIERHYGVGRLVQFSIPLHGDGPVVDARLAADLLHNLPEQPNFEGLVHLGENLGLINDNHTGVVRGQSALWVLGPLQ